MYMVLLIGYYQETSLQGTLKLITACFQRDLLVLELVESGPSYGAATQPIVPFTNVQLILNGG